MEMYYALRLKDPQDTRAVGGEYLVLNVDPPRVFAFVGGKPREVARFSDQAVPFLLRPWDRDRVGQLVRIALQKLSNSESADRAAQAYAELTHRCARCHRRITNIRSVQRGLGPECAQKGGRVV